AVTAHEEPKTKPDLFNEVEETLRWTIEAGHAIAARPVGKFHRPPKRLFDFIEQVGLRLRLFMRRNGDRRLAIFRHAGAVHNIDAKIHHGTAARKLLVNAPCTLPKHESKGARHLHKA